MLGKATRDFACGCGASFYNNAGLQTHMSRHFKLACAPQRSASAFFAGAATRTPDTMRREEQPAERARIVPPVTDSAQGERASGGAVLTPLPEKQREMATKEALVEEFARIMVTFFHLTEPARMPSKNQLRTFSHDQLASMICAFGALFLALTSPSKYFHYDIGVS